MRIFSYSDYRVWVKDQLQSMPKAGRGQLKRIADHLAISPTIVTQVFRGDRDLTPEQALSLADYFSLTKTETRFLVLLVNYSRAGSHRYREALREEIDEFQAKARQLSTHVKQNFEITDEAKSVLYSNWFYLAVWSLTAIEGFNSLEVIAERLKLSRKKAREAIDFLLKYSLVIADENGQLKVGPTLVHLEESSPQIPRHHQSWRLQAFNQYENVKTESLHYTAPVTLSEHDVQRIRQNILKFINESVDIIKDSPSERLYCFCLDWFEV